MDDAQLQEAASTLLDFFKEMSAWETRYHELYRRENGGPEKNGEAARSDLKKIYDRFLTPKDRKTGRMAGPSAGYPPEHDPRSESITSTAWINKNKISIATTWRHPEINDYSENRRYTLVHSDSRWLLDKQENFSAYKEKWGNRVL